VGFPAEAPIVVVVVDGLVVVGVAVVGVVVGGLVVVGVDDSVEYGIGNGEPPVVPPPGDVGIP